MLASGSHRQMGRELWRDLKPSDCRARNQETQNTQRRPAQLGRSSVTSTRGTTTATLARTWAMMVAARSSPVEVPLRSIAPPRLPLLPALPPLLVSPTLTASAVAASGRNATVPAIGVVGRLGRHGPHERRRGNRGDRKSAHELLHRISFLPSHTVPAAGAEARFPPGVLPRLSHPTACGHHLAYTHRRRCQDTNVLRPPCYQNQRAAFSVGFAAVLQGPRKSLASDQTLYSRRQARHDRNAEPVRRNRTD